MISKKTVAALTVMAVTALMPVTAFATGSLPSGGGGGSSTGGSTGGGSGTGTGSGFSNVLTSQTVSTGGATLFGKAGSSDVTLTVPNGAFSSPEQVTVASTNSTSDLGTAIPTNDSFIVGISVSFSGANPAVPVTLTITDSSIPAGAKVYKIGAGGQLVPVQATVTAGKAVLTFTSDPSFIVLSSKAAKAPTPPKLGMGQKWLDFKGHTIVAPGFVNHGTTYVGIWYVMHELQQVGVHSQWNGYQWHMTTSLPVSYSGFPVTNGQDHIYLNGKVVYNVPGIVRKNYGTSTTFMPIWYVMQTLKHVGLQSSWNGTDWIIN